MYLWSIHRVLQELNSNSVPLYEKIIYTLGTCVFLIFFTCFPLVIENPLFGYKGLYVTVTLALLSIIMSYITNKEHDGKHFIERFMSIGFPVGVRVSVWTITIYLIFGLLTWIVYEQINNQQSEQQQTEQTKSKGLPIFGAFKKVVTLPAKPIKSIGEGIRSGVTTQVHQVIMMYLNYGLWILVLLLTILPCVWYSLAIRYYIGRINNESKKE